MSAPSYRSSSANMTESHPGIDPMAADRWVRRPQTESPWLHDEIGQRMAQRLAWIKTPVASWLNWEPVQGGKQTHVQVGQHYVDAPVYFHTDQAQPVDAVVAKTLLQQSSLWQKWRGTARMRASSHTLVDLLWANMVLHQHSHPAGLMQQWFHHINPGGFLMFSCFGPDTLKELRSIYQRMGWPPAAQDWIDMHDWGDLVMRCGFAEPVMDMERITLTYTHLPRLLEDLRSLGRNLHPQRSAVVRGRKGHQQWCADVMREWPRQADGSLGLTFEVVYGHAHKPTTPRTAPTTASAQQISMGEMRQMLGLKQRSS
jgi:malonyl-CoA O-methyltransferase